MVISNNGFDCQEMYERPCEPELQAVRMGVACYECRVCGSLTSRSVSGYYSDRE